MRMTICLYKCLKMKKTRWWFQIFFICKLGEMIQFDLRIFFKLGWFNHQFLRFLALFLQHFFAEKPHNLRTSSHEGPPFETPFCRLEPFIQLGGGEVLKTNAIPPRSSGATNFSLGIQENISPNPVTPEKRYFMSPEHTCKSCNTKNLRRY